MLWTELIIFTWARAGYFWLINKENVRTLYEFPTFSQLGFEIYQWFLLDLHVQKTCRCKSTRDKDRWLFSMQHCQPHSLNMPNEKADHDVIVGVSHHTMYSSVTASLVFKSIDLHVHGSFWLLIIRKYKCNKVAIMEDRCIMC